MTNQIDTEDRMDEGDRMDQVKQILESRGYGFESTVDRNSFELWFAAGWEADHSGTPEEWADSYEQTITEREAAWDGFVIVCDSVLDSAMGAARALLDEHHPEYSWDVRAPRAGETDGTYGKMRGQLPQILGYTVPVPVDVWEMVRDAFNAAIDAGHKQGAINTAIRESLGHGDGNRRVKIHQDGRVEYYGSTDPTDRDHDYWHYAGERDELALYLPREEQ